MPQARCLASNTARLQKEVDLICKVEACTRGDAQMRIKGDEMAELVLVCFTLFGQRYRTDSAGGEFRWEIEMWAGGSARTRINGNKMAESVFSLFHVVWTVISHSCSRKGV